MQVHKFDIPDNVMCEYTKSWVRCIETPAQAC